MKNFQKKIEDFVFSGEQKLNSGKAQGLSIIIGIVFSFFGLGMGFGSWAANFYLGLSILVITIAYSIVATIIGIKLGANPSVNYFYSGFPQMYISIISLLLSLQLAQLSSQTAMLSSICIVTYCAAILLKIILVRRAISADKYQGIAAGKRPDLTSTAISLAVLSFPITRLLFSGIDFENGMIIGCMCGLVLAIVMAMNLTYILRFYYINKYSIEVRDPDDLVTPK